MRTTITTLSDFSLQFKLKAVYLKTVQYVMREQAIESIRYRFALADGVPSESAESIQNREVAMNICLTSLLCPVQ